MGRRQGGAQRDGLDSCGFQERLRADVVELGCEFVHAIEDEESRGWVDAHAPASNTTGS